MRAAARRGLMVATVLTAALTLAAVLAAPYRRGAAFIAQATGADGLLRAVATYSGEDVSRQPGDVRIPWRGGTLRAYVYDPAHRSGRGVLVVHGIHADGIDEPRLVAFAREIAAEGHPVVTVELPDLKAYAITPRTTDMIEDTAAWMMRRPDFQGTDGRIGIMGISFGGGLSVVAAGRPAVSDGVAYVLSFGGHGDLPRTLRYLCTGVQPDGTHRPPHDYGLAIVLLGAAGQVVPADQVAPLRAAILSFLEASRLDLVDKGRSAAEFARARRLATDLGEPARTYMEYVNARDVARLGPILLPHLPAVGGDPALSPDRSDPPMCPVFLLHGADDNVVPAIESTLLAHWLRERGRRARVLLTPLVTHAEVDRHSTMMDIVRLIDFWTAVLNE